MVAAQEDYKGYNIAIEYDDIAVDPREEWDNMATMVCGHNRYRLGDKKMPREAESVWHDFLIYVGRENELYDEEHELIALSKIEKFIDKNIIYLPLYLYDHSGITMNTTGFSCGWDSGQVGYIYVHKKKALEWMCWKNMSKSRKEKIYEYLEGEVETYDNFLRGEVYFYSVEKDGETLDSCGGYYGDDGFNQALAEAKAHVEFDLREIESKKWGDFIRNDMEVNDEDYSRCAR